MKLMCLAWLWVAAGVVLPAQQTAVPVPVFDVSQSHSVETLLLSGLKYKLDTSDRLIFLSPQEFVLRLPGGREIAQRIESGHVKAKDNQLQTFYVAGPVLPLEEAVAIARKFHEAFHMPQDKLEAWRLQALKRPLDGDIYTDNAEIIFPAMGIEIRHSGNPLYPWFVSFNGGWIAPRHKGWDEARGARENSTPPKGLERISLDAANGRVYRSEDAYVDLARQQREHNAALQRAREEKERASPDEGKHRESDSPGLTSPNMPSAAVAPGIDGSDSSTAQIVIPRLVENKTIRDRVEG